MFELAMLAMFVGLPSAYADPAEECCMDPRHADCSGCQGGYLLGSGELYGCMQVSTGVGCSTQLLECQYVEGPIIRWRDGTDCSVYQEMSMGVSILKNGCYQTVCD
jgi:hypothetical protein